jgi:SAM-dependent methyltransferase
MHEQERRGVWSLLEAPFVYEAFHHLIGARRWLKHFAADVIRAKPGDRVLDIGCGPGALLKYLPAVHYVGLDRNPACIEQARRTFRGRGEFACADVTDLHGRAIEAVDVAVAIGLLHHLDDDGARRLLRAAAAILKPGGRLVTADPCYHRSQSPIIRFVVSHDRGRHVRDLERYHELVDEVLPAATSSLVSGHLPFPHAICVVEGARR